MWNEDEQHAAPGAGGTDGSRPSISGCRIRRVLTGPGSPGGGLWVVTTDTRAKRELSVRREQPDTVAGDWKTERSQTPGERRRKEVCVCLCEGIEEVWSAKDCGSGGILSLTYRYKRLRY